MKKGFKMTTNIAKEPPSEYEILQDVVKAYPGIMSASEILFQELKSYPRKWDTIVKELKNHALKNFYLHDHHEKGSEAIKAVISIFLEAIDSSTDPSVQQAAIDGLIFYIEKILIDGSNNLNKYGAILNYCFQRLFQFDKNHFSMLITNPHQLKKLGQIIYGKMPNQLDIVQFNNLLFRFFSETYEFWLNEQDPIKWFCDGKNYNLSKKELKNIEELLFPLSHENLRKILSHLQTINASSDQMHRLKELLQLPGYLQLVKYHEDLINKLNITGDLSRDLNLKIFYLFKIMETKGLASIHENTLREINRTVSSIIKIEQSDQIQKILVDLFIILKKCMSQFPETVLYLIQSIGNEIYATNSSKLVEWYLNKIISLGFQYPEIQGTTEEWQVKSNRTHLKNIRTWLELIENSPKWSKSLISALIINLKLAGVHIDDTDIFQKDVTKLLNSDIKPVYSLVKKLAKLFPVYFSEVGAEGPLREVSTEIDEITGRADLLIHFLRKQSHVESSYRVVDFIESVINFWLTKNKSYLKEFIPSELYERIKTEGHFVDELHVIFNHIFREKGFHSITDLLTLSDEEIIQITNSIPHVSEREKKRSFLAIKFYHLLRKKYKLDPQHIKDHLKSAQSLGLPGPETLITTLENGNVFDKLDGVLNYMQMLKDIILSPEKFEPVENLFRKRHIAVGIASIYGKYNERKFDALALTFRLENLANILFEELICSINLKFITRATLFDIERFAKLFFKAMQLDGISSNRFENTLELLSVALEVRRFSFSQYIDIFKGFSEAVQDILNTYYNDVFKNNLKKIILQIGEKNILPKYLEAGNSNTEFEFIHTVSEQFLREIVASSFGLQQLDTFISNILKTLFEQSEELDIQNLDLLMSYDPKKSLSNIYSPNNATYDRIHLGNKGYNLVKMASLGIPVPPGFIITTEVFRCEKSINKFFYAREHLEEGITEEITKLEKLTGKIFGNPENPLLVSVRSGGAISMPGMMISFLNVGINESIVEGLINQTKRPWFAWDCYRRFLQCWGMSYGMERDKFDEIMNSFKLKYKVSKKIQFSPTQMKDVAFAYREAILSNGIEISDDPKMQLKIAISQVFQSWFSKKAQTYRELLCISENWGTAVIVQAMVYGNLGTESGTGVLFTRNPYESSDKVLLWGDFATGAQGEDIVLGLVKTLPISNDQKPFEDRITEPSFEESFPEVYDELLKIIKDLIYKERWGAQEIEFTFEGKSKDKLFILQTRDMTISRKEKIMAFMPSKKLLSHYLSRGIGVGGGAMSGRIVFDLDEIQHFKKEDPSVNVILVRSDTVPDDIKHISAADGLLTARGGSTSHAAIIANRLGKTCVVGCNNLIVWEQEKKCKINNRILRTGDFLSIDGRNGSVYTGKHLIEEIKAEIISDL